MSSPPACLHLCFGEAREDLLSHHQVFAEHRFPIQGGEVSLFVIGASSIVVVEVDALRLAEMIACGPSRQGFGAISEARLELQVGGHGRITSRATHYRYQGEVRSEALMSCVDAGGDAGGDRLPEKLRFRFPTTGSPLTLIQAAEVEPGLLELATVHEYPEHGVRVLSRSRWDFREISETRS